jgi:hypothetical protein
VLYAGGKEWMLVKSERGGLAGKDQATKASTLGSDFVLVLGRRPGI